MRVPLIAGWTVALRDVVVRFPEALLAGVVAAVVAMVTVHGGHGDAPGAAWAAAGLAISLSFLAATASEGLRPERIGRFDTLRLGLALAAIAAAVAFAFAWLHWSDNTRAHRLVQFAIASHLCAAFAPFVRRHDSNAFWQWNRSLFVRFVIGGIFSAVLFGGLALALAAAKPLFGLTVPERTFLDLWLGVAFVFQTTYFLAGVPRDFGSLAANRDYPLVLKVFAQFLLVPLVALYLVMLTAYLVKVLVTGQWPNGWIGWLVSSVSAAGLLAILLVHPVRDREENRWVDTFSRWFFVLLLPSVGMLFAAIGKRVGQYGLTEERYDLFALAAWVTLVAIGYSWRRRADIRWIPVSLCAVALLTSFGPWGAYTVSRVDQARRLAKLLARLDVRPDGQLAVARELSFEDRKQVGEAVRYLVGSHGLAALPAALRAAAERDVEWSGKAGRGRADAYRAAQAVLTGMGQDYVRPQDMFGTRLFSFSAGQQDHAMEPLAGFDHMVRLSGSPEQAWTYERSGLRVAIDSRTRALTVTDTLGGRWTFALDSLVTARARSAQTAIAPTERALRFDAVSGTSPARLVLRHLEGVIRADSTSIRDLDGELLIAR